MEFLVRGTTLPEVFHQALVNLQIYGELSSCNDWNTRQKEVSMTMEVTNPFAEPMISKCFIGGPRELEQYVLETVDGLLDFEVLAGNWQHSYHDRLKDQIAFVLNELRRNPDSRRAVMDPRRPEDMKPGADPTCLMNIQYFIRNGALNCKVLFRSNDACKAAFEDMFALIMLQKYIADELGLPVGTYTHRANSFHAYEADFAMLNSYCTSIINGTTMTYPYVGDEEDGAWKPLMDAEKPALYKMAQELYERRRDVIERAMEAKNDH